MINEQYVPKVRVHQALTYKSDYTWEARAIERIKVKPELSECVHCDTRFQPRFLGDQICGVCSR